MDPYSSTPAVPMTHDEKSFFKQLGARIAALRKEQDMTQAQLADRLDLTQQMVASYEVGRRRVPVSLLPQIASTLAVSVEDLIGRDSGTPRQARTRAQVAAADRAHPAAPARPAEVRHADARHRPATGRALMSFNLADLTAREWVMVAATIAGPIFAVQAQKWIERFRERRHRKQTLFQQLMATRAARLSAEHVQALNMIDLVFYGSHVFGIHRRSKTERIVNEAWREYHDHLGTQYAADAGAVWNTRLDELFTNLLFAIATDVRFKFDRVQLKKGVYSPQAHGDLEREQIVARKLALEVLAGTRAIKMDVASFPADEAALKAQTDLSKALTEALAGKGALTVSIKPSE